MRILGKCTCNYVKRLYWMNILDQDYDDEEDIEACRELTILILGLTNVHKDDIVDRLQNYVDLKGFGRLSDSDIASSYGSISGMPSISQQKFLDDYEGDNVENFETCEENGRSCCPPKFPRTGKIRLS